ncbi:MAG: GNAT family N-acetyltransferase [Methyloligellaceae bacterium]
MATHTAANPATTADFRDALADASAEATSHSRPKARLITEFVTQIETLERAETAWRSLAARALVPNSNYGPGVLLPTFRHFAADEPGAGCILVWQDHDRLIGFLPCRRPRLRWGVPMPTLVNWALPHMALGVPLLDRDCAEEAFAAMLAEARKQAGPAGVLILEEIDGAGPFRALLDKALAAGQHPSAVPFAFERAAFVPEQSFDVYQRLHYKSKTRQTYRRKRKKLAELGHLETVFLDRWEDIEHQLDAFLALEGSGWKRRSGTALICDPQWRAWHYDVVRNAARDGTCLFAALRLNGQMLAGAVVDWRETTAELGKIAYDESYARYSPGGLLTLDTLEWISQLDYQERVRRRPGLEMFDSAARPDNDTLYAQFKQRRPIEHRIIGLAPRMARWRFAPFAWIEAMRRKAIPHVKAVLHTTVPRAKTVVRIAVPHVKAVLNRLRRL